MQQIGSQSDGDTKPVTKFFTLAMSALVGCTMVIGKYLTPTKKGKFYFRAPDPLSAVGETVFGAVVGLTICMGSSILYGWSKGAVSNIEGALGVSGVALGVYVGYSFFMTGPIGKAYRTIEGFGRTILRRPKLAAEESRPAMTYAIPNGPTIKIVYGNLFNQKTETWVNAWNTNVMRRFFLRPFHTSFGVSGTLAELTGRKTFRELASKGAMPAGSAVFTTAGARSDYLKGIYHTASMRMILGSDVKIIKKSMIAVGNDAYERGIDTIAAPVLGSGHGKVPAVEAIISMVDGISNSKFKGILTIVIKNDEPFKAHDENDPFPKTFLLRRFFRRFP